MHIAWRRANSKRLRLPFSSAAFLYKSTGASFEYCCQTGPALGTNRRWSGRPAESGLWAGGLSGASQHSAGLNADTPATLNAAHIFSARNVAIGIALLIVLIVGVPESIAIVMIIRLLVETQDLVLQILAGATLPTLLMPIVFMVIELVVIVTMVRIVGTQHNAADGQATTLQPSSR